MFSYDNGSEVGTIACDKCGEEYVATGSYKECVEDAKYAGWSVIYDQELRSYYHYCPDDK